MYFYYIMSYSNGLLPSTTTSTNEPQRGLPGVGFKLTADGNFDINGKLLTNVAGPVNGDDATNKNYVDTKNSQQYIAIADKASKSDLNSKLSIDGSISMASNLNMNSNKVINVSGGTDTGDAVNYGQLLKNTENHQNNYNLQPSFTFYKNFGDQARLSPQNINIPNHNHHDLLVVKKEGSSTGFGGYAWASLQMVNNNLHDFQTTHSKVFIYFKSNGQPGLINFQIRYYGSNYNSADLNFLFFSRVLAGRVGYAFNHALFDVDDVQLANQILYFEDVNLNENKIKGLGAPSEDKDGANKKYVDDEIAKLPHSDTGTLKLDGSRAMTGNLQMGGFGINNIKPFVEDDSSQAASFAQKYDVVNWGKIHEIRGSLKIDLNRISYEALNRQNPDPMLDPIDMGNNFITNVKEPGPSNSNYATTVNFVNKTIDDRLKHSVQSAHTSNAFQYVMDDPAGQFYDDDIKGIKKTDKDFHKSNKETYEMQLLLDSRGYYSSRLGVNMYILPNGEYSLVYELYYPNSIDSSTVQISAISTVETVSNVTTNVFNNHTRSIIYLHKYNNVAPNRLMIDMVLKNKAGISYANELTIFVIVYGVSGYFNNVHTSVWDRLFEVTNNTIKFEATIDMNKHDIKNVDNLSINKLIDMNNGHT